MRKATSLNYLLHSYFLLTVIGVFQFIFAGDLYIAQLFGFRTGIHGLFLARVADNLGFSTIARIFFIVWPVLVICFVISYILAAWKHKYRLFTILVILDLFISLLICLCHVFAGSYGAGILCAVGIIINFCMGVVSIRYRKNRVA